MLALVQLKLQDLALRHKVVIAFSWLDKPKQCTTCGHLLHLSSSRSSDDAHALQWSLSIGFLVLSEIV